MKPHSSFPEKVLIIGSGIGGLSTAIILAKLGFDVTVLEKNRWPGGLMRSYTRDGIECAVGVHYLGSLDKGQILRKFLIISGLLTRFLYRVWVRTPLSTDLFSTPPPTIQHNLIYYGVLRSSSQILGTALLNRTVVKGLYLAGQNVMAPGIIGTILGSFSTVKLILGDKEFKKWSVCEEREGV